LEREPGKGGEGPPGNPHDEEPLVKKRPRRRELRKRKVVDQEKEWETARHDAWLRELLTDSSEGGSKDKYTRFAESGRWITEMTGSRDRGQYKLGSRKDDGSINVIAVKVTTTS
jgi:hypothetical protein